MLSLKEHIDLNTTTKASEIVGLIIKEGKVTVRFPYGYAISEDDDEVRKDVISLLSVLKKFGQGEKGGYGESINHDFPVNAYLYIIRDFLDNGYYIEREPHFKSGTRGKLSWKRTISQKKPQFCGGDPLYLDFIVRAVRINEDNMLTQIHSYCVYCAFHLLGYIFTSFMPQRPEIKENIPLYKSIVKKELVSTFNDSKKMLLKSMLLILEDTERNDIQSRECQWFGTTSFHTVWEKLVDHVYGDEENIRKFYPSAAWYDMEGEEIRPASKLRPDTVMKHKDELYILDAKYYTYGIDPKKGTLPATDSIQKQMTYAEHAINHSFADKDKVYNAFILPFNGSGEVLRTKLIAEADWRDKSTADGISQFYRYIPAVLLDTKTLIRKYGKNDQDAITALAEEISKRVIEFADLRKKDR